MNKDNPYAIITVDDGYIKFVVVKDNPNGGKPYEMSGGQPYNNPNRKPKDAKLNGPVPPPVIGPPLELALEYVLATCNNFAHQRVNFEIRWEGVEADPRVMHVVNDGSTCPACGSQDIEGDEWDCIGQGGATQEMRCNNCGAGWYDEYRLSGFSLFEKGEI